MRQETKANWQHGQRLLPSEYPYLQNWLQHWVYICSVCGITTIKSEVPGQSWVCDYCCDELAIKLAPTISKRR
jgi:rubrerythrin